MNNFRRQFVYLMPFLVGSYASALDLHHEFGKTPLVFEPNRGQWAAFASFGSHGRDFNTQISAQELVLSLKGERIGMRWSAADKQATLDGLDLLPGVSNYYVGRDPSQWKTGVPQYGRVRVEKLYPGIGLVYYGKDGALEYDLEIEPGADPRQIRMAFEGAKHLSINPAGDLVIGTKAGDLVQHRPLVYQVVGGRRAEVGSKYRLKNQREVAIEVTGHDRRRKLVIDPVITWGRAIGSSINNNSGAAVGVDGSGNVYLAGSTSGSDFPLVNAYDNTLSGSEAILVKYSADGSTVLFSTFLGGSSNDAAYALAVDSAGNVYVAGNTQSADFPTKTPYQAALSGFSDAFLAKFSPTGGLTYSTYLGGSSVESASGLAIDAVGNSYVAGWTSSSDFPTVSAFQSATGGGQDAFVAKFAPNGSSLVFSTYLGGAGGDLANAIAVGATGIVYVAGGTGSNNFPTKTPIQSGATGGNSAFVTALNATGAVLVYSTYLGVNANAVAYGIDVDSSGAAYVTGNTFSGFPLVNAIQNSFGSVVSTDAFVSKIAPSGDSLVYSTYLGGSYFDTGYGIRVDGSAVVTLVGTTQSPDFPTYAALKPSLGSNSSAFVTQLNASGTAFVFSTFLGGIGNVTAAGVAEDSSGAVYVVGQTGAPDFPPPGTSSDFPLAYVVKLAGPATSIPVTIASAPSGLSINVDGANILTPKTFQWAPGVTHQLTANSPQNMFGQSYAFSYWSNGGSQTQSVATPASATTYTANFQGNSTLQAISVTPSSGMAGRQVFTFVARNPSGASNIQYTQFLFTKSGVSALNACYISYDPAANVFYLLSDDLSRWYGLLAGTSNTIGNAQCTIYGATSGSTKSGADLSTTVDISYRSGFAGLKTIYQFSGDNIGNVTGWISMGTWNDTGDPSAVELISLTPSSGNGASQVFTAVTKDGDGALTIPFVQLVMNATLNGFNACFIHYDRASNVFFLLNDAGSAWSGLVAGSATQVSNSQCTLHGVGSGGTAAGSNLTITYNLDLSAGFAGAKKVFIQAVDDTGIIEVWHQIGTWTR